MKVGDLVRYNCLPHKNVHYDSLVGIILSIKSCWSMGEIHDIMVAWSDGSTNHDMRHSELEVISESR